MKNLVLFLVKYFLYWLLFFLIAKALFLISNFKQTVSLSFSEILNIFRFGLKMDISTVCYFLVFPGLIVTLINFISKRLSHRLVWVYTLILLIFNSLLLLTDLKLYPHWGTRIGSQVLNYIRDSVAITASVSWLDLLTALIFTGTIVSVFIYLFRLLFTLRKFQEVNLRWYHIPLSLFMLSALIIPIRGGFNTSPLNTSSIAFSPKLYVNQAALNYIWNFGHSIQKRKVFSNPCNYVESGEAKRIFETYKASENIYESIDLLQDTVKYFKPNVILIILESFSDKVTASLGGKYPVTPCLDSICRESIVFDSFYASGNRSDRGVSALLASYPSLLYSSVMQFTEKWEHLKFLPQYFNRHNYSTSFYYGGDINFYNLKSFAIKGEYAKIIEKSDFPAYLGRMTKWGVPDGYLFNRALQEIRKDTVPSFITLYTISSHPPYDVPFSKIKGNTIEDRYLNSIAYTDSCLGSFIHLLKKMAFWKNSLVIITADHGALQPGPTEISHPDTYRIPLIWTGGLIRKPMVISNICGQTDLMPTLVRQLGWLPGTIRFGRDIFSEPQYAFYMLDSGWGYIVPQGKFYYNQEKGNFEVIERNGDQPVDFSFPKSYLQVLHEDFIKR
jgi:phosphoglycerol transferase MdoB-like AlkP superfamily enzyme